MADHSHTHAPGEEHSHSHGPPQQQQPQAQQGMQPPPPDPALQALIEADFKEVPLTFSTTDNSGLPNVVAICSAHKLEKCLDCNVDFLNTNRLSRLLAANPTLLCPPPANVISQKLTTAITQVKEEGNRLFKKGQYAQAVAHFTTAAQLATQRPPWEASQFMREELSTVVSNRSAAYFSAGDYIGALVDADTVISLRRNWSKGHFRKAKALLGLGKLEEAKEAVRLGLSYEPNNTELTDFLADIERVAQGFAAHKANRLAAPLQAVAVA